MKGNATTSDGREIKELFAGQTLESYLALPTDDAQDTYLLQKF